LHINCTKIASKGYRLGLLNKNTQKLMKRMTPK
jgi:hypothetical protein